MKKPANFDLRTAAKNAGVPLWAIADALHISEPGNCAENLGRPKKGKFSTSSRRLQRWIAMKGTERAQSANPPFQKIEDAVRTTGLSAYYLRRGCRNGSIPCVRSGRTIYVNVPQLLRQFGATSTIAENGEVVKCQTQKSITTYD